MKNLMTSLVVFSCMFACGPDYNYDGGTLREECDAAVGKARPRTCDLLPPKHVVYGNWSGGETADGGVVSSDGGHTSYPPSSDAGSDDDCKPGNGWGDKNHCHSGGGDRH